MIEPAAHNMDTYQPPVDPTSIAETVRRACLQAAQQAYERSAADGLCDEGALEVALDAIRSLDLNQILLTLKPQDDG